MKKILILGGSSDIGIKLISKLNIEKYILHLHYNTSKSIKGIPKEITKIKINLKDISKIEKKFDNDYDIILNLVGYISKQRFDSFNVNQVFDTLKINSLAMFKIVNNCIKHMKSNRYGRIINTSSVGVKYGGGRDTFAYSLSKHVNEFIPSPLRDLSKYNVLYNTVRIGVTNTKIHKNINNKSIKKRSTLIPVGKFAEPEDIVSLLIYLIENNNFITNSILDITGGE